MRGHVNFCTDINVTEFCLHLAEIDKLKKDQASMVKPLEEIQHSTAKITNLQKAMRLEDNKILYNNCRVHLFLFYD